MTSFRRMASFVFLSTMLLSSGLCADPDQVNAFTQNKKLGRGVNILSPDPIWRSMDRARFTLRHFQLIKAAGFSSVRINLAPFRAMDATNNYQISDAWLKVLDWAVKGALDNGLMAILDFHEYTAMGNDPEGNHERFLAFWKQIAPRFKDAPSSVLFELLNEPGRKLSAELWNTYLAEALAIVRQTNRNRTVIIGPADFNRIGPPLDELKLPENDRNIIVTLHYYVPMVFTHQGAPWHPELTKTGVTWGTEEEKNAVLKDFERAQAWAKAHDRPILLGEFGAYDRGGAPEESRLRYTAFVARAAEKLGWSWAYWQFDGDFIVYNMSEDHWVTPVRDALIPR